MFARGFAIISLIVSSAAVAAPEPKQPSGKWVVHFDDAQCVATRQYGPAEKPVYLALKAPPVGDILQIGLVWKGGYREAIQTRGEIVFDDGEPVVTNLLEFGNKKLGHPGRRITPDQGLVGSVIGSIGWLKVRCQAEPRAHP